MARTARSKFRRNRRKHMKSNPAGGGALDTAIQVGAGFGGFAANRLISRIASTAVSKKWPRAAKHVGVLASALSTAAVYFFGDKVKYTAPYADAILMGSGVGTLATAFQSYAPVKFSWMIAHPTEDAALPASAAPAQIAQGDDILPEGAPAETWTYNDAFDAGRYAAEQAAGPSVEPTAATDVTSSFEDILNSNDDELGAGIFAQGN